MGKKVNDSWEMMSDSEKKEWVCARLEDEVSKDIFRDKNSYNESGDRKYLENIIKKYLPELNEYGAYYFGKEKDFLKAVWDKNQKIVVFGAGVLGNRLLDIAEETGIKIAYVCDNAPEKQHTQIRKHLYVISFQELLNMEDVCEYAVVVSPYFKCEEIKEMLIRGGIIEDNIFLFNKARVYVVHEKQYFDEDIVHLQDREVFVDAGCLDLGTTKILMKKMSQKNLVVEKVFAFEPDAVNYHNCEKVYFDKGMKVELINAGLWCRDTNLSFYCDGSGSSHVVETDKNGNAQVKVVALDSCIRDRVTFIKMDIEGAELKALEGARELIRKHKPKLAICLYHKNEDMWEIPYFIKNLVPEYKLYIRHYSNYLYETVLYAV